MVLIFCGHLFNSNFCIFRFFRFFLNVLFFSCSFLYNKSVSQASLEQMGRDLQNFVIKLTQCEIEKDHCFRIAYQIRIKMIIPNCMIDYEFHRILTRCGINSLSIPITVAYIYIGHISCI